MLDPDFEILQLRFYLKSLQFSLSTHIPLYRIQYLSGDVTLIILMLISKYMDNSYGFHKTGWSSLLQIRYLLATHARGLALSLKMLCIVDSWVAKTV
jgi:hypothetical protein